MSRFTFPQQVALATVLWIGAGGAIGFVGARAAGGETARESERTIHVPNSQAVLSLWGEVGPDGTAIPHYGIRLDGEVVVDSEAADYVLGLRYQFFDPLEGEPAVSPVLQADPEGRLFLVQFVTPPLELFAEQISSLGGFVRRYVAQNAYLVEMGPEVRAAVESLPYVRWVGPYQPAYRLEEYMIENLDQATQAYPLQRYSIMVLEPAEKQIVADRLAGLGAQVDRADAGKSLVEATLTPEELFRVVHWDEVLFVDRWSPYEPDMDIVRRLEGADSIEVAAGYTGAGVRGEVFDTGFNLGHHDFQSRPLIQHGNTGSDSHGAATSGICFGDGAGQSQARGLLPNGQGIVADYNFVGMTGPSRYNHDMELLQEPYKAVFQTSSVGSSLTTQYTTVSADTDDLLFDSDVVHCQSQSNAGTQNSRPQAWAKNMISVGGVYHYNNENRADDCWCHGASIGPASDGTIKPTLCNFYDWIYTTYCCGYESYTSGFNGTSSATPITAGHVGLFFQMWADGIFGNEVNPDSTVFANRCHMSTARAMMINTAYQYPFQGTGHDMTRMHQGWGTPDLQNMYDLREKFFVVDQTRLLRPFGVNQQLVTVDPGEPALKATMTYPDLPGNPAVQSQHRVNDLTLRVISPTGTVYYGNNGLLEGNWSAPGGVADHKNVVECVFVQNPEVGDWTIEVRADQIFQDADPSTLGLDSPYALVVSGVRVVDVSDVDGSLHPGSALGLVLSGPNPASRSAHLKFSLSAESDVRLEIYDPQGRLVSRLLNGRLAAGIHSIEWQGRADDGASVHTGVYFARLSVAGAMSTQKLIIVR